jgi:hypothetical protein
MVGFPEIFSYLVSKRSSLVRASFFILNFRPTKSTFRSSTSKRPYFTYALLILSLTSSIFCIFHHSLHLRIYCNPNFLPHSCSLPQISSAGWSCHHHHPFHPFEYEVFLFYRYLSTALFSPLALLLNLQIVSRACSWLSASDGRLLPYLLRYLEHPGIRTLSRRFGSFAFSALK